MKKLVLTCFVYGILILLVLELGVRAFHLTKDYPVRYIDKFGVEKWQPNQTGYSVTGNRKQNFSEYRINNSGFNSYREFTPSSDKTEIALVGDSFIEGFHQDYYNSIGKKIENNIGDIEVYEYGYAGYDLADQLHLMHQYQNTFKLIDYVFIGLEFDTDLLRPEYSISNERMKLETPVYKILRQCKLLVYLQSIGILDAPKNLISKLSKANKIKAQTTEQELYPLYLNNFKHLVNTYHFDKNKYIFLIDAKKTPASFLNYLNNNQYRYLDFSETLNRSKNSTTLIYDMHWNNYGRTLIAETIGSYVLQSGTSKSQLTNF
ncbi:hypothetical protein [Formosa sp. A9]|uniref:hypothetical protein n=1 Tax=Formosa sp. A9 TaxID=3442641 RepID=UPI003EBE4F0A